MRQSRKLMLLASVAVVTTAVVALLGIDHAMASDFGTLATGKLKQQTGGAAYMVKQVSVLLGAGFGIGGVISLYNKAKEQFKGGAKDVLTSVGMIGAGGAALSVPYLINNVTRASIGDNGNGQTIDNKTGGDVGWN